MPNRDELNAAVDAGVIARADADRLEQFLRERRRGSPVPASSGENFEDAETVRFVRGFHDVFLSVGVILLLLGVSYSVNILREGFWFLAAAGTSWLLAEYLARGKKLMLPSVVLSVAFGIGGAMTINLLIHLAGGITPAANPSTAENFANGALIGGGSALLASLLFYLRFRLPFTLAQIVLTGAFFIGALVNYFNPGEITIYDSPVFLVIGLAVFLLAVRLDVKDPERKTINADNAFWLHLAAAPLIVHVGVGFVWGETVSSLSVPDALTVLALIGFIGFVALLIDRRAMLVAGLFYFGAALFVLIQNTQIEEGSVFALTLVVLGGALLLLGVGWRPARAFILTKLMPQALARNLPTLRQA